MSVDADEVGGDQTIPTPGPFAERRLLLDWRASAASLGVGTTTLDALIAAGDLPAIRIGRRVLVHVDDIAGYIEQLRSEAHRRAST